MATLRSIRHAPPLGFDRRPGLTFDGHATRQRLALVFLGPGPASQQATVTHRRTQTRVHNLYTDADGESRFRDLDVGRAEETNFSGYSEMRPATGLIFRETSGDHDLGRHPAPRRQYIINLDAGVRITASDGECRTLNAGEVMLVEDTSGKGHLSKAVDGKMRHSIFVAVD